MKMKTIKLLKVKIKLQLMKIMKSPIILLIYLHIYNLLQRLCYYLLNNIRAYLGYIRDSQNLVPSQSLQ